MIISKCLKDYFNTNNKSFLSFCNKTFYPVRSWRLWYCLYYFSPSDLAEQSHPIIVKKLRRMAPLPHVPGICQRLLSPKHRVNDQEWRIAGMFADVHHPLMSLFNLQLGNFRPLPPSPEHSHSPLISTHTIDMDWTSSCYLHRMRSHLAFVPQLMGQSLMDKDNSDTLSKWVDWHWNTENTETCDIWYFNCMFCFFPSLFTDITEVGLVFSHVQPVLAKKTAVKVVCASSLYWHWHGAKAEVRRCI